MRVNTNLLSRSEAIEHFVQDGWVEYNGGTELSSYDAFLEAVKNLGDSEFLSDIHVKNLFVFPASSKRFWAFNRLVLESKLILQDKVRLDKANFRVIFLFNEIDF